MKSKKEMRYELARAALACVPAKFRNSDGDLECRNPVNIAEEAVLIAYAVLLELYPGEL